MIKADALLDIAQSGWQTRGERSRFSAGNRSLVRRVSEVFKSMLTEKTSAHPATANKPLVLVVDDEYGPRESIAFTLSSEFTVETAERAAEALGKLKERSYSAVVLDIR